ncbi:hypothetical protein EMCRGX_G019993 [Ephydatia muelleri]
MPRWFTSAKGGKQWKRMQCSVRLYTKLSPWPPKQVLVVQKISRLDFERKKHPHLSPEALKDKLIRQGTKYESLESRRQVHRESLKQIEAHLKSQNVDVRMRESHKETLTHEDIEWADLVVAAGGDGNYLRTASMIHTSDKLMVGINTDPCSKAHSISHLLNAVFSGGVRLFHRHRVRAVWEGGQRHTLALNEVLVGEKDPAQSSYYDLVVDSNSAERQKSSGVLVYTGTGSTSCLARVNSIMAIARGKGSSFPPDVQLDAFVREVTDAYNRTNVFSGEDPCMAFTVREPVTTGIFAAKTTHGFARKLLIHTFSWQNGLMVDGHLRYRLHNGSVVEFSVQPEDALLTAEILET